MSKKPMLQVEHLSMKFGGLMAINDLSFEAYEGDITALIGPNGAGKTTVFNCITGFYKPTQGLVSLNHDDGASFLLERMPDFRISWKAKVARTFQNIRLFGGMTVLENLLIAQHNPLMIASGLASAATRRARRKRSRRPSSGSTRSTSPIAPTTRPPTCPMATSAGSRSRAPCAPIRCCSAWTSPRPASTRAKARS